MGPILPTPGIDGGKYRYLTVPVPIHHHDTLIEPAERLDGFVRSSDVKAPKRGNDFERADPLRDGRLLAAKWQKKKPRKRSALQGSFRRCSKEFNLGMVIRV